MEPALVGIGAGVGGMLRYAVSEAAASRGLAPWGTAVLNSLSPRLALSLALTLCG